MAVQLFRPGLITYEAGTRLQLETARRLRDGRGDEGLALLQHPPVYTLGRRTHYEHLLSSIEELRARGAEVVETDRGGDVTFHGPGQLIAYPLLDLRKRGFGARAYVWRLEETLIRTLDSFGVRGERVGGRPGVWLGHARIAAIGVRIEGGVSRHGCALNVETDLAWFEAIVPCGLSDAGVTSLKRERGHSPGLEAVEEAFVRAFEDVFETVLVEDCVADIRGDMRNPTDESVGYGVEERKLTDSSVRSSDHRALAFRDNQATSRLAVSRG